MISNNISSQSLKQLLLIGGGLLLTLLFGLITGMGTFLPLAIVLGIVTVSVIMVKPIIGLYAMLMLIPFENLFMIGDQVSLTRIVGIGAMVAWVAHLLIERNLSTKIIKGKLTIPILLFLAVVFASASWARFRDHLPTAFLTQLQLLAFYLMFIDQVKTWKALKIALVALVFSTLIAILIGLNQFFVIGYARGGDEIVGSVNAYAALIVTMLPMALYLMMFEKNSSWVKRVLGLITFPLGLLGVAVSGSRAGYLLLPIGFLLFVYEIGIKKFLKIFVIIVIFAIVTINFVPWDFVNMRMADLTKESINDPEFGSNRGFLWRLAISIFLDHPLIGSGYRNYGYEARETYQFNVPGAPFVLQSPGSAHSMYLAMLADLGIVGFSIFAALLVTAFIILRDVRARVSSSSDLTALVSILRIAFILYLIYGFSASTLENKLLWLLFAIVQSVDLISSANHSIDSTEATNYASC